MPPRTCFGTKVVKREPSRVGQRHVYLFALTECDEFEFIFFALAFVFSGDGKLF